MLNRFREKLIPITTLIGNNFGSLGLSPTFWSMIGFAFAILSSIFFGLTNFLNQQGIEFPSQIFASILLLISGFFDIVDGSVARVMKKSTTKGAFLDSNFDKISEALIFIGIAIGGLSNPILAMIALSISILVSYLRARAESLGIELKGVGIGERAERLLILSICGFIPISESIQWGVIIIILISGFSFLQRFRYVLRRI
ncbi:MAG: CDP-alcohol phosphatidyltransferase family protein [Nitrososphaeraceae archaeon]|nr:CDP-alcohol phosphatidyltransferase family protein [Nitrososphaeraceae archaeon]MDW0138433.1 CDP-alcohol phosphatidyltransferase family protein [Nitrososphaeraceae archaeon]MDW0142047.1 CDP-alcohol phosphatidyltransferase family protein [Nitrososphaeraceae archaeon]MDW0145272.1 CDP-alcohol phosphatidyltransferase family protein [Nitrososphaeraceae archaeon]MDW0148382.1 CDP-alcohol phosphatidyltransferase family protein [Nitrososphaeraceae archaeon]